MTVASFGSGLSAAPMVNVALGASGNEVSMVSTETPIVIFNVAGASEADMTVAAAAAEVLSLEVRFDDLVKRTPHGLSQLRPLLRRSKPSILVVVTDFDASEASEAEVSAFVARELDDLAKSMEVSVSDWKPECVCLPSRTSAEYEDALSHLRETLTAKARTLSNPAFASLATIQETARLAISPPSSAAPSEVHASYKASQCAKEALRQFRADAVEIQTASDSGLMVDFGGQAAAVIDNALETFDALAADNTLSVVVVSTRQALVEQMHRMIYGSFRKQLVTLQRACLEQFVKKVEATPPCADLEARLEKELSEALKEFEILASQLIPPGADWSYSYERTAVFDLMGDVATEHVQNHQIQGMYVSQKKKKIPVEFSAHWLTMNPFTRPWKKRFDAFDVEGDYFRALKDKKSAPNTENFNKRLKDFQKVAKDKFASWTVGDVM
jgi:hypothetical protein